MNQFNDNYNLNRTDTRALSNTFVSNVFLWMFAALDLEYGDQDPDDDEFLEVEKIPLEKAVEMVISGEIKDAKTQAAILKLNYMLDNKLI